MYTVSGFTKCRIAWASIFALAVSVVWLTGCERKGAASEYSGEARADNLQRAPEPVDPWTADRLIEAERLARIVSDPGNSKPLILNFGPVVLFKREHVPDAKLIGPLSEPDGPKNLQKEVKNLGRDSEIVLYCGCCPWNVCPNVRPAFQVLQDMGFKRVKVLYLPNNFRQNWVNKGFPVQKEQ
jgi:hypothetical protein